MNLHCVGPRTMRTTRPAGPQWSAMAVNPKWVLTSGYPVVVRVVRTKSHCGPMSTTSGDATSPERTNTDDQRKVNRHEPTNNPLR